MKLTILTYPDIQLSPETDIDRLDATLDKDVINRNKTTAFYPWVMHSERSQNTFDKRTVTFLSTYEREPTKRNLFVFFLSRK